MLLKAFWWLLLLVLESYQIWYLCCIFCIRNIIKHFTGLKSEITFCQCQSVKLQIIAGAGLSWYNSFNIFITIILSSCFVWKIPNLSLSQHVSIHISSGTGRSQKISSFQKYCFSCFRQAWLCQCIWQFL